MDAMRSDKHEIHRVISTCEDFFQRRGFLRELVSYLRLSVVARISLNQLEYEITRAIMSFYGSDKFII